VTARAAGPRLHGVLGEFAGADALIGAVRAARAEGWRAMDAFTPFPIEELSEALDLAPSRMPLLVLLGATLGGLLGYGLQYWTAVIDYPLNIGGRPDHSWPAFIVVTFELSFLGGGLAAVLGMLALSRLPMPYHPLFAVERFALVSRDRFFLCLEARDPGFDANRAAALLRRLGARETWEVEP
jgi:hypothetical protein